MVHPYMIRFYGSYVGAYKKEDEKKGGGKKGWGGGGGGEEREKKAFHLDSNVGLSACKLQHLTIELSQPAGVAHHLHSQLS